MIQRSKKSYVSMMTYCKYSTHVRMYTKAVCHVKQIRAKKLSLSIFTKM